MAGETEVLDLTVNTKKALAEMERWQRETVDALQKIMKVTSELGFDTQKVAKKAIDAQTDWADSARDLFKVYRQEGKEIDDIKRQVTELASKFDDASETEQKAIAKQVKEYQKLGKVKVEALKERGELGKGLRDTSAAAADAFKESLRSVFGRDLKGLVESGSKAAAKSFKILPAAWKVFKGGAKGGAAGGAKGAAASAGGAGNALKGVGDLVKAIKPMISMATAVGAIAGSVVMLIKLFLDLDSAAKEFNKSLLQSAGTSGFLAQRGGDVDAAYQDVETTLRGVRDAANSSENMQWGITPADHQNLMNNLNQEGITLNSIGKQGGDSAEGVQKLATSLVHTGVAYSRAFGVPLQEIGQLQAEMAHEMGISLNNTSHEFERIAQTADEAGIGAVKFFGMIRGVSQDLSLWGLRMEDATTILGKLMKNMTPREAQKFFQTLTQGFKGMGRMDLVRKAFMGDLKKTRVTMESEIQRMSRNTAEELGAGLGYNEDQIRDLQQKITAGGASAITDLLPKVSEEVRSSVSSAVSHLETQQRRLSRGTVMGLAEAMADAGPAAAAEIRRQTMLSRTGFKSLKEAEGAKGGDAVAFIAEALGESVEAVRELGMFEEHVQTQQQKLISELADPKTMEATQKKLSKAGIKGSKEAIENASWSAIWETMSKDQQKLIKGEKETIDYAKRTADFQTSFIQKFEALMGFVMNQIYNIMIDVWDAITSLTNWGGGIEKTLKRAVMASKSQETAKIYEETKGDPGKFKDALRDQTDYAANLGNALKGENSAEIEDMITKSLSLLSTKEAASAAGITNVGGKTNIDEIIDNLQGEERSKFFEKAGTWFVDAAKMVELQSKFESVAKTAGDTAKGATEGATRTGVTTVERAGAPAATRTGVTTVERAAPVAPAVSEATGEALGLSSEQTSSLQSIDNQLDRLKMDTGFLSGPYANTLENSMLAALRTALFEYYLYKDMNQADVLGTMVSGGFTGRSFSQAVGAQAQTGQINLNDLPVAGANATGGVVSNVSGGLALVRAAAGEGLASVGRGETIAPRGGGSTGGISIQVNGVGGQDLARIIETKVIDGIHEYKRRERFT
jgi:hypothetical protein